MMAKMYRIHGLVQGVGFRYFVYHHAQVLGLKGYVQNELDGTVTVVAQGENETLLVFEKYVKSGPGFSQVREVETTTISPVNYDDFEIR